MIQKRHLRSRAISCRRQRRHALSKTRHPMPNLLSFPALVSIIGMKGGNDVCFRRRCARREDASFRFRRHKLQVERISYHSCNFCEERQCLAEATATMVGGPPSLTKNDLVMRCAFDPNSILASKPAALVWMAKAKRKKPPAALPFFPAFEKWQKKRGRVIRRGRFVRLSKPASLCAARRQTSLQAS